MNSLKRTEFIKKLVGGLLAAFLAFLALTLGSRTAIGNDCSECPGKGLCRGDIDCNTYLK